MKVLAIDTTLGACSVAVMSDDTVIAHRMVPMMRGHAEALAPMVEQAVADAGLAFSSFDRLGVTVGPGTFTGLRVGLAFMRGLRLALGVPLVGITSLAAMAHEAIDQSGLSTAVSVHDTGRDALYFEMVSINGAGAGPELLTLGEAVAIVSGRAEQEQIVLSGTAAQKMAEQIHTANRIHLSAIVIPNAIWVARLCRKSQVLDDVPKPLYLHSPNATRPGPVK